MLPADWKKEIKEAVDQAANSAKESEERREQREHSIAASLDRLANEFVGYKREQNEADQKKTWNEKLTVWGLVINAVATVILAAITGGLVWVAWKTDHTLTDTMVNGQRAYLVV